MLSRAVTAIRKKSILNRKDREKRKKCAGADNASLSSGVASETIPSADAVCGSDGAVTYNVDEKELTPSSPSIVHVQRQHRGNNEHADDGVVVGDSDQLSSISNNSLRESKSNNRIDDGVFDRNDDVHSTRRNCIPSATTSSSATTSYYTFNQFDLSHDNVSNSIKSEGDYIILCLSLEIIGEEKIFLK